MRMRSFPGVVFLSVALTALTVLLTFGCIPEPRGTSHSGGTGVPSPRIIYFKAEPPEVGAGGTSRLKWKTEHAVSVSISGIGAVTPAGTGNISVRPGGSTTYELTATNASGQFVKESAKITVMVPLKGKLPPGFTPPGTGIKPKTPVEIKPQKKILPDLRLLPR